MNIYWSFPRRYDPQKINMRSGNDFAPNRQQTTSWRNDIQFNWHIYASWSFPRRYDPQKINMRSGNDVAPNRQQTTSWRNDIQFNWHIYASSVYLRIALKLTATLLPWYLIQIPQPFQISEQISQLRDPPRSDGKASCPKRKAAIGTASPTVFDGNSNSKSNFAPMQILMNWSLQMFAHDATAVLPWYVQNFMMTSSNGSIFLVTGPLWG